VYLKTLSLRRDEVPSEAFLALALNRHWGNGLYVLARLSD
jgi:hypothetical protein